MRVVVGELVTEIRQRRRPGVPLWETAAAVWSDVVLDEVTFEALAFAGQVTFCHELPVVQNMLRSRFDLDRKVPEPREQLAFVGFMVIALELLVDKDALN